MNRRESLERVQLRLLAAGMSAVTPSSFLATKGFLAAAGGLFGLVDILFIFGSERRCIHDLIAQTKVVVAEPLPRERGDRDD